MHTTGDDAEDAGVKPLAQPAKAKADRTRREAAALRANLSKRKDQARQRRALAAEKGDAME